MDKAEQIMGVITQVAESLGLPVEIDRAYPVMTDPLGDGPSDMPLVVVRTGDEVPYTGSDSEGDWKDPLTRWIMTPSIVCFLQNREDPNALRTQANAIFLQLVAGIKASNLKSLLLPRARLDMSKSMQPMPGRPDVFMLVVPFELAFKR